MHAAVWLAAAQALHRSIDLSRCCAGSSPTNWPCSASRAVARSQAAPARAGTLSLTAAQRPARCTIAAANTTCCPASPSHPRTLQPTARGTFPLCWQAPRRPRRAACTRRHSSGRLPPARSQSEGRRRGRGRTTRWRPPAPAGCPPCAPARWIRGGRLCYERMALWRCCLVVSFRPTTFGEPLQGL